MSKNNYQKPSNTGKKQIIYGLHAVKAALLNNKRNHYELLITENHQKLADNYKSKIQKITLFSNSLYNIMKYFLIEHLNVHFLPENYI